MCDAASRRNRHHPSYADLRSDTCACAPSLATHLDLRVLEQDITDAGAHDKGLIDGEDIEPGEQEHILGR